MLISFSKTLSNLVWLDVFLGEICKYIKKITINENYKGVVGWGHKSTATKAREYARIYKLPYIALEDGFLRSLDLGCNKADPLSLVVDKSGIYYDAKDVSDLESFLNSNVWEQKELINSSKLAIKKIISHHLSKYNHSPDAPSNLLGVYQKKSLRILLLDQTAGDASVELGLASKDSFLKMLDDARNRFPKGRFFVKTHPDVLAGKKKGFLTDIPQTDAIKIIAENYSPISLLEQADIVYTVTSQMGFEALMLGKPVYCFGMPFYAGWGLTHDFLTCPRRKVKRKVEEVFAAAYMLYARYVDPIREKRTDVHDTIRRLACQREMNETNRGFHACFGYSLRKHRFAKAFLQSTGGKLQFYRYFWGMERAVAAAKKHHGDVVAWSSQCIDGRLEALCKKANVPLLRMEDGFIRSVGLGSNFYWPYSLVVDKRGIYYDPRQESDLEVILNKIQSHKDYQELIDRALAIRSFIVKQGLTKYNVGNKTQLHFPQNKKIILVPGQVENDASVRCGGGEIQTNLALLQKVRENNPEAYIVYKPHPDVEAKNRAGKIEEPVALRYADTVLTNVNMDVALNAVDEVHTLTSLTGFEALIRNIPVTTYGGPFYAGWGLTNDHLTFERRKAKLTLDELVAGVLLLYPRYYDWKTKSFCFAEDVCYRLTQPKDQPRASSFGRICARLYAFMKGIR